MHFNVSSILHGDHAAVPMRRHLFVLFEPEASRSYPRIREWTGGTEAFSVCVSLPARHQGAPLSSSPPAFLPLLWTIPLHICLTDRMQGVEGNSLGVESPVERH